MVKSVLGDACAYIPSPRQGDKARYYKIGLAMRDGDRISIKIDTLPLPGMGWSGWINIFPSDKPARPTDPRDRAVGQSLPRSAAGASGFDDFEDDIPF